MTRVYIPTKSEAVHNMPTDVFRNFRDKIGTQISENSKLGYGAVRYIFNETDDGIVKNAVKNYWRAENKWFNTNKYLTPEAIEFEFFFVNYFVGLGYKVHVTRVGWDDPQYNVDVVWKNRYPIHTIWG